ncbi:hypothetical protein HJFPF1_11394 [Paramyrothecium foliicola]|nr:hypothetical protein HJFPF1_11394 [Paramyrothecium foliicola]
MELPCATASTAGSKTVYEGTAALGKAVIISQSVLHLLAVLPYIRDDDVARLQSPNFDNTRLHSFPTFP